MKSIFLAVLILLQTMFCVIKAQNTGCDICGPDPGKYQNRPNGTFSATLGINSSTTGVYSLAVGNSARANGGTSMALGAFVRANATNAIVLGSGTGDLDNKALINNIPSSLMIGFNSKNPTLFVGPSLGNGTTGKVGVGNVVDPRAKLHIMSDQNEDAGIILEPKNKVTNKVFLQMYDDSHIISVSDKGMDIKALDDNLSIEAKRVVLAGKIGINIDDELDELYDYSLAVSGGILTNEVYVKEVEDWYDVVFEDDYQLTSLSDLERYIKENKHLPDMPSESEVLTKGYEVVKLQGLLLKKIEELTLYTIELQKQLEEQQHIIDNLK